MIGWHRCKGNQIAISMLNVNLHLVGLNLTNAFFVFFQFDKADMIEGIRCVKVVIMMLGYVSDALRVLDF